MRRIGFLVALFLAALATPVSAGSRPQIMVVGLAHFVSKADVHNADFMDPFDPVMQTQIQSVAQRLLRFKPTKVLLECIPADSRCATEYGGYLRGSYKLTGNEIDQIGYRVAALAKNATVYGVDYRTPLDFKGLLASANSNKQTYMDEAEAHIKACGLDRMSALEKRGALLELLQLLNSPAGLDCNASWYMYAARIGGGPDYAGADFAAAWYARNLHILANIMRVTDTGDRALVLIGQGHAALLDPLLKLSPYADFIDPLSYLT